MKSEVVNKFSLVDASEHYYLVLPGISGDINHPMLGMIYDDLVADIKSVVVIEYPFQTTKSDPSEGLIDEIEAVNTIISDMRGRGMSEYTIIAKSLGAIIAARMLVDRQVFAECRGLYILGCVISSPGTLGVDVDLARDRIRCVIQGELDHFGGAAEVRDYLSASGCVAEVVEIKDGDHSYRHLGISDAPTHERQAVDALMARINSDEAKAGYRSREHTKRTAVRGLCVRDGKILAIRRSRYGESYLVLPGGGIELGETDLEVAAREVLEETSINVQPMKLLVTVPQTDKFSEQRIVLCEYLSGEPHLPHGSEEAMRSDNAQNSYEPCWVSLEEARSALMPVEVRMFV